MQMDKNWWQDVAALQKLLIYAQKESERLALADVSQKLNEAVFKVIQVNMSKDQNPSKKKIN